MIILVDMDGVLADFESNMAQRWLALHPQGPTYPRERDTWDAWEILPDHTKDTFIEIMCEEGFFHTMPPIPGSLEAVQEMSRLGHEVFLCTAPVISSDICSMEKVMWVRKHLGTAYVKRMIITSDKTVVHGDLLIDDKPLITGVAKPTWEHVIYTHCYNRNVTGQKRLTWENWREVLGL